MDRAEEWHIKERKNGRKGMVTALTITAIILLILFFMLIPLSRSEDQIEGVLIDFGNSRTGSGTNSQPQQVEEVIEEVTPQETQETAPAQASTPDVADEVVTQDFEEAPAINTEPKKTPEQLAAEQRAAEQEAREKKEAEEKAAAQQLKNDLDQAWDSGDGNTTPGGDQGVQDGVENGPYNDGTSSTGLGDSGIGHDLSGRTMEIRPKIKDTSQKTGKVAIRVRVDRNGKVLSAEYSSRGSNTVDSYLVQLAIQAAKEAKFSSNFNAPAEQTGTITFNFRVR